MSSLEEPVAATHHLHSKALAATGCVPVPAPLRGSIAAANAPIAHDKRTQKRPSAAIGAR